MRVPGECRPFLELSTLTFRSLGGVEITGYTIAGYDEEPRPLIVHSHGYGFAVRHPMEMGGARI